ncbi:MAG: Uma2 family endonuclease [Blastocatellia bacterium]|nr:Uma2 family endonuclease [Blastocatellia bacterium]
MGLPAAKKSYSVEEYLVLERASQERYEYLDGDLLLMAGESREHADISSNLLREFGNQLKGTSCRAWTKDMKVRSGPSPENATTTKGLYSHPDIVVVCGAPEFHDDHTDVLLNPRLIIEVLSPSTEAFDRGTKFWRYRSWNQTLTDYLVVSQTDPFIECFSRQADGTWAIAATYVELSETLVIDSLKIRIPLREIYDRVFS